MPTTGRSQQGTTAGMISRALTIENRLRGVCGGQKLSLEEMKRAVLPRRTSNKRMQPTARRARRG